MSDEKRGAGAVLGTNSAQDEDCASRPCPCECHREDIEEPAPHVVGCSWRDPSEAPPRWEATLLARIEAWTHEMGSTLKPPGADTYGEGVRDCKAQVARMLASMPWERSDYASSLTAALHEAYRTALAGEQAIIGDGHNPGVLLHREDRAGTRDVVAAAVRMADAGTASEDLLRAVREMQAKAYPGMVTFGPMPGQKRSDGHG